METERVKSVYAVHSHFYDSIFGRLYAPGRLAAIRLMDIRPGQEILEVGVGTGVSLPHYPKHARVVGIDVSKEMLAKAEERKTSLGLSNVEVYEMDAGKMDFPDGRFDKVIAAHVISVVPEPLKVIKEMKRVCKDGGEVYILNYVNASNGVIAWFERQFSPIRKALGLGKDVDFGAIIKEAGLSIDHIEKVNILGLCRLIKCRKSTPQER
jgi:phosphatidylethanolamine/phosphatidyl-N-methylethanolamine N-methyltransferase